MTWQTKVASWVIPLLADYVVPDDAIVITGVEFATLDDATGAKTLQGETRTAEYPGLVPDYSLDPEVTPTTGGTQYNLKAKKAVGFYGLRCDVVSYNDKRLNSWNFPLLRRNFGFISMSRSSTVAADFSLHYASQYHFAEAIQALALNYDDDFSQSNLFNSVDKFCLTRVDVFLYPDVVLQVRFLPIWEVWAVRFFREELSVCSQPFNGEPPGGTERGLSAPPPYGSGTSVASQDGFTYTLKCSDASGYTWQQERRWNG